MLHCENDLRRAPETQFAMERAEASADTEWMDIVEGLQIEIVKKFQNMQSPAITLEELRSAAMRYPDIAHWVKFNRARYGKLKAGDAAPNVPLLCAKTYEETTLLTNNLLYSNVRDANKRQKKKPVVIIAGSLS